MQTILIDGEELDEIMFKHNMQEVADN